MVSGFTLLQPQLITGGLGSLIQIRSTASVLFDVVIRTDASMSPVAEMVFAQS